MTRFTRFLQGCILVVGLSVIAWDSGRYASAYQEGPCPGGNVFCGIRCHWPVVMCDSPTNCWIVDCLGGTETLYDDLSPDPELSECVARCTLETEASDYHQCLLGCPM